MLKISTKTSIYKPIEVEVNGRIFKIERIDTEMMKKLSEIQKEIAMGNLENITEQMTVLFPDMPRKLIQKLDIREVNAITYYLAEMIVTPEKKEGATEKKA